MQQQVSEQQIVQMAQKEEAVLKSKQNFLRKVFNILTDSERTISSLEELAKNPEKMYMNLGSGVLIEVKAKDIKKCKRAFAENGYLEEDIKGTVSWLETKRESSRKQIARIEQDIATSETKLNDLVNVLKQIDAQKQKEFNISKK
jgi:prefoldin subunit 5